jgi:hypothetical protein
MDLTFKFTGARYEQPNTATSSLAQTLLAAAVIITY